MELFILVEVTTWIVYKSMVMRLWGIETGSQNLTQYPPKNLSLKFYHSTMTGEKQTLFERLGLNICLSMA